MVRLLVTVVDALTAEPPEADVYQPLKEYPVRDGVGRLPIVEPYVTLRAVGLTEPPLALNETVKVLSDHFA
ncbi:MAG: hypothetical protein CVU43_22380 [Chloroflexi bacterium HGW-Chloroflexi-5]|nr:MAG: hypothetical protein CVU43_22380 [Chloroflexi bacterium HGW-Chloroflexi-5]